MSKRIYNGYYTDDRPFLKRFYDRYEGWIAAVSIGATIGFGVWLYKQDVDNNPYSNPMYEKEKTFKEEVIDFLKEIDEMLGGKKKPYGTNTHNNFFKVSDELTSAGNIASLAVAKPALNA